MKTFPTQGVLKELDSGGYHRVLEISNELVAKIPMDSTINKKNLIDEFKITKKLYDRGISVPRPYGVFNVCVNPTFKITDPGIVMQRIQGIRVDHLGGTLRGFAEKLMEEELKRCERAGFSPFDEGIENTIYSPKEHKIYLIDFQNWRVL